MASGLFNFSRSDSLEISYFHVCKRILEFLGFWPQSQLNKTTIIKRLFNLTLLLTAIIGEFKFSWFLRKDPIKALGAVCPCLTKMVTWIKFICFAFYRDELKFILKNLYEHCLSDTKDNKKNSIIARVSFFTNVWCIVVYLTALSTNILFAVKPLIVWSYQYIKGDRNVWVELPFRAALPYEDMTQLNNKTLYSFIYCLLVHSGNLTILGISGIDGVFLCFCMYISASYQCLQEDFKRTFKIYTWKGFNSRNNDILYNDLRLLIRRQQNIINIFQRFNRVYRFMVFIHFLFASIILGIIMVNLLLGSEFSHVIYLTYAMGAGTQLFTYCYGAESVNKNCLKLAEIIYFCDWYKCNKKVKSLILFVLVKSQKGSFMRAPFFSPSLQLFASIIQTSGSYFTILQAVL